MFNIKLMARLGRNYLPSCYKLAPRWKYYSNKNSHSYSRLPVVNLPGTSIISDSEWENYLDSAKGKRRKSHAEGIHTRILGACYEERRHDLASSFVEYLKRNKIELNPLAKCHYLRIIATSSSRNDEERFNVLYKEILSMGSISVFFLGIIIDALCITKRIPEALQLLKSDCQFHSMSKIRIKLIEEIFLQFTLDDAWKMIDGICNGAIKSITIPEALFTKIVNSSNEYIEMMNFFKFVHEGQISLTLPNAMAALPILRTSKKWKRFNILSIYSNCICKNCGGTLKFLEIDAQSVEILKNETEKYIVTRGDIFQSSTVKEWYKFKNFLELKPSFKLVVDGLNFFTSLRDFRTRIDVGMEFLGKQRGNVLIISKNHARHYCSNVPENVSVFYVDNLSRDDVFLLYGALHSGLGTKFLSRDQFRDHMALLPDEGTRILFHNWQKLHQLHFYMKYGATTLKELYTYVIEPQFTEESKSWHIPIQDEPDTEIDTSRKWLCCPIGE